MPSRVPAVPLPGVRGLRPSWASGWPEQHTRWALLGAPLIGREGMHLSPVRGSSGSAGRRSHPLGRQMQQPVVGRVTGEVRGWVGGDWALREEGTHLTVRLPLFLCLSVP